MRVFMTGATGVIGRRAVPLLIAAGHRVTGVARTPAKRRQLERAGAVAADVNLFDADSVRRALAGYDAVINLATHMPSSSWQMFLPGAWKENDRLRRDASANLVDAALACGVTKFIQESFAPTYAGGGDRWVDEGAPVRPVRYNRTVLDAENAAGRFNAAGRVGVVLRFALFYGADGPFTRELIDTVRRGSARPRSSSCSSCPSRSSRYSSCPRSTAASGGRACLPSSSSWETCSSRRSPLQPALSQRRTLSRARAVGGSWPTFAAGEY